MRRARSMMVLAGVLALAAGCGDGGMSTVDAGGGNDAATADGGGVDAGSSDGGSVDAGGSDAGTIDAGGEDAATIEVDAGSSDAGPVAFTLTSTAYDEGGVIPDENACSGANTSPPLAWVGAPAGTMSFALVFTDMSNGLIHWALYDIPATRTDLPADVDMGTSPADVPGARQVPNYDRTTLAYAGPCPPSMHTYQFELYALDVTSLPGSPGTRAQVETAAMAHSLGSATLTATYTPP
jgi:Raf kinase inhibitor-like YbhB/YbcL family protein